MYEEMQESGLTEIIPLKCTSATGASILCFLILSALGSLLAAAVADDLMAATSLFADMAGNTFRSHFYSLLTVKGKVSKFYDNNFYG